MPDQPATLAISNQKGGVGKTAVAINVAGALAARNHDVLFVDVDPQGNATEAWGAMDAYEAEPPNLFNVLTDPSKRDAASQLITDVGEVDLLPSNIDMTAAEPELTTARRSGEQLNIVLNDIATDYDYVIIDCPPNLGYLVDNAIYAAQNVLVPALAEETSKRAFELLADHVYALERDYEMAVDERGVIINRIDVRKNQAHNMIDWIEQTYDDIPVWRVRERADIQQALADHQSLQQYAPDNDMAAVFTEIAASLDEQFGITEAIA